MKKYLIVSTVGTSLLTNQADQDQRRFLLENSNCTKTSCSKEFLEVVDSIAEIARKKLENSDVIGLKRSCAELNGLYSVYEVNGISPKEVFHALIATDTYQGELTSKILSDEIGKSSAGIIVEIPKKLNTLKKESFDEGIKNLLKWCDQVLPDYKSNGYEIIFNLTGSFKVLQGYLSSIGMFYADRITYIFDGEQPGLIEIPKLPINIDLSVLQYHITEFLLMKAGLNLSYDEVKDIRSSLIDTIESKYFLSVWGELLWDKSKETLLKNSLPNLPFINYEETFRKDFEKTNDSKYKVKLIETLAKASKLIIENNGKINGLKTDGGLQYDNYSGKSINNNPIGHFRIDKGDRISCTYINNKLNLRHFGPHDYVNNNP